MKSHFINDKIRKFNISSDDLNKMRCMYAKPDLYIAYIRGKRCKTEDSFFKELSAALQFPWYFGENWPALDECLCDLDWLHFSKLLIIIDDFGSVFSGEIVMQNRLIRYLCTAIDYWNSESHAVENESKKIIEVWLNK